MKILRVLRRRKIRLSFILILLMVFIFNTYAWVSYDKSVGTGGALVATVSSWAVEFVIEDEDLKTEEYTYEIEEFHPGIDPIEKKISVYNVGEASSDIDYKITEIYLYGKEIFKVGEGEDLIPETIGAETTTGDYTTANAFGNSTATIFAASNSYGFSLRYPTPFLITYTYDKTYVEGNQGVESSKASLKLNLEWENDENNNEEDTKIGNLAYEFYKNNPDEPALKIKLKVIATKHDM